MRRVLPMFAVAVLVLLAARFAYADGESRATTPAERQFLETAAAIVEKAMPPVFPGWTAGAVSKPDVARTAPGERTEPMPFYVAVSWEDEKRLASASVAGAAAMEKVAEKLRTDGIARQAELAKQIETLSKRFGDAIQKSDMAAAERVQKEMAPIQAELEKIGQTQEAAVDAALAPTRVHDARIRLTISVNASSHDLDGRQPEADVAGVPTWRREGEPGDTYAGETIAALGFKAVDDGDMRGIQAVFDPARPKTAAQTVLVEIQGEKAQCRQLLEKIDWAALKKLVGK